MLRLNHHIILLLSIFGLSTSVCGQNKKSNLVNDVEEIFSLIEIKDVIASDTLRLNAFTDSIEAEGNIEKTEYTRFFILFQKRKIFRGNAHKIYFNAQLQYFATCKTPGVRAFWKFYYGESLFGDQDYATAIQLMLEAKSEFENIGYENIPEVSIPLYLLSLHYYEFNNYTQSVAYAALADKYRVHNVTPGTSNTIGLAYQKLGMYDSAISRFKQTMLESKTDLKGWYAIASGNLGRTYCLKKNYKEGIPLLLNDVNLGAIADPLNSGLSALYVADAFNNQRLPDSVVRYLQLAKKMVQDGGFWESEQFYQHKFGYYYYVQKAELNKLLGNFKEAYKNQDTANINKEKVDSKYDWQLLTSAEKRMQGLEYQQNINLLASQKKNQQLQKLILFIVLGAVLSIAFLFRYSENIKRRKEKQLAAEKEANLLLKKEAAELELKNAQQQLNELMIQFQEKSMLHENVAAGMAEISKNESGLLTKEQSEKILTDLTNASLLTNRDWELFQQRFEKVYDRFFTNLAREVPGITPAEERMLALLKLKVSYRQMAQMLGISPESVRTAKYRLRKKLSASNQPELLMQLEE